MKASITFHAQGDGRVALKDLSDTQWLSISGPDVEIALFAGHDVEQKLAFVGQLREAVDAWYGSLADEQAKRVTEAARAYIETQGV